MVNLQINKARALKVISIITFIELIISVAWPIEIISTHPVGLGVFVVIPIFAIAFIYYAIFIIFLSRYSKKAADDQNIGTVIFFNVLPVIAAILFL